MPCIREDKRTLQRCQCIPTKEAHLQRLFKTTKCDSPKRASMCGGNNTSSYMDGAPATATSLLSLTHPSVALHFPALQQGYQMHSCNRTSDQMGSTACLSKGRQGQLQPFAPPLTSYEHPVASQTPPLSTIVELGSEGSRGPGLLARGGLPHEPVQQHTAHQSINQSIKAQDQLCQGPTRRSIQGS